MAYDKYDQDINIVRDQDLDAEHEKNEENENAELRSVEEYESSYEQILDKFFETGYVSDSDLSLISSMDGNVIPFALKDRLERMKKSKEHKSRKHAKDIGHFDNKARDLTVGKESGRYTQAKDHSGPVDAKSIEAERSQPEPAKKPASAPFKGPSTPTPPTTPTPKQ